jgi:hypothetical protein
MKNTGTSLIISLIALIFVAAACNMSTANLSGLTTSTDKDGKTASSSFKTGDTINGRAPVANNPGKVKVKFTLTADDVKGMTKGEAVKNSEVSVDIDKDGTAIYAMPVTSAMTGGKYKLTADMMNEAGEKKDSKSADITVTQSATPPVAPVTDDDDK